MKRVTNFQPLRIGMIWQTDIEKEKILKQPFSVAGGNEIAYIESLRDLVHPENEKLRELLEVPYNNNLKIE